MAELKELKSRYDGKCVKCGRELRQGWNIFYDPETKQTYCKPCGSQMIGVAGSSLATSLSKINTFYGTCCRCDSAINSMPAYIDLVTGDVYCEACGALVLETSSRSTGKIELALADVKNTLDLTASNLVLLNDTVPQLGQAIDKINERLNVIETNVLTLVTKSAKDKTETAKTKPE